jgi:dihydrofolate reductase
MTEPRTQTLDERKVVLYTLMSLDGAVDDPGRYFTGSRSGEAPEFDSLMNDNERRIIGAQDAVVLGRHMYDEWSRYWPKVDHQPFADFINNVKKYVVTSTPLSNGWHNSEAVAGPIEDLVRDLKASERSRPACDQATMSCAATTGPMPGSSSSAGASARTCCATLAPRCLPSRALARW